MHNIFYRLQNEAGEGEGGTGTSFSPEEIAARLSVAEGSFKEEEKEEESIENKEVDKDTAIPPQPYVASPIWDVLKADEGFTMPEDLTAENEQELIKPFLAKKFGFDTAPELHPLAKQIQDMAVNNPNLTINDLVNDVAEQFVDASKMSVDEKITFDLFARYGKHDAEKNPDGITQEDVEAYLNKLSQIEKKEAAKTIEQNINEYNKKLTDDYKAQNQARFEAQHESDVKQIKGAVSKLKVDLSKVDSVYGVPVSQDDHAKWLEEFERVVTPDKTTGQRGFDDILSNDMLLYKAYVIMAKFGEDKVIEIMTKGRESAKEELFKKLGMTPSFSGGNTREYVSGKDVNYEEAAKMLSIPQR